MAKEIQMLYAGKTVEMDELAFRKLNGRLTAFAVLAGEDEGGEKKYLSRALSVPSQKVYGLACGLGKTGSGEDIFSQALGSLGIELIETYWDGKEGTLKFSDGGEEKVSFEVAVLSKLAGGGKFVSYEGATASLEELGKQTRARYSGKLKEEKLEKIIADSRQGIESARAVLLNNEGTKEEPPEMDENSYRSVELRRADVVAHKGSLSTLDPETAERTSQIAKDFLEDGDKFFGLTFVAKDYTNILKKGTYLVGFLPRPRGSADDAAEVAAKRFNGEITGESPTAAGDFATLVYRMMKGRGAKVSGAYIDVIPVMTKETDGGEGQFMVRAVGCTIKFEHSGKTHTIGNVMDPERLAAEGIGKSRAHAARIAYAAAAGGDAVDFKLRKIAPDGEQVIVTKPKEKHDIDPNI